jgi:molybdate transport system substrate-binding protein
MHTMKALVFGILGSWLAIAGCSSPSTPAAGNDQAVPLRVAAASDLRLALEAMLAALADRQPNLRVEPVYGSSGQFYAQIVQGAPFDLYLSADVQYPRKLIEQGLALPDSEFQYARGQLVLWARGDCPLPVETQGLEILRDQRVQKIAIAHPDHAPYGRAAVAALRHYGLYELVEPRLVRAENIAQAAQFVQSGAADVGIVALSLVRAPSSQDAGRLWLVPSESYPPLVQSGVILRTARSPEAARQLRQFMLSDEGQALLKQFGFLPAEGP